jgi:hypothetical protein
MRTMMIGIVMVGLGIASVAAQQKPEATSLAGKPLYPIELPNRAKLEGDLAQAE